METVEDLTHLTRILLTADAFDRKTESPFSIEQLTVKAWQLFPKYYGLKGYVHDYPDNNKVIAYVVGVKGILKRGWFTQMGPKLYRLTNLGENYIRQLTGEKPPASDGIRLSKALEEHLLRWLINPATNKFEEGLKATITFTDACAFWGLPSIKGSEGAPLTDGKGSLEVTAQNLRSLEKLLDGTFAVMNNGQVVEEKTVRLIKNIHHWLLDRYNRHLDLLTNRHKKRGV